MVAGGRGDRPDLYVVARLLERLSREDAPMGKTRLQVAANVNYDVFTRYLDWLRDRGLVSLEGNPDGHDRVALTPKGYDAYRKLVQWISEVVQGRAPGEIPDHLTHVEIGVPLSVANDPSSEEREQEPANVPRTDLRTQFDSGPPGDRLEPVPVSDVGCRIPSRDLVAAPRLQNDMLVDRDGRGPSGMVLHPDLLSVPA